MKEKILEFLKDYLSGPAFKKWFREKILKVRPDQILIREINSGICPYMGTQCLGSKCMSFNVYEEEWAETHLVENPETKRMESQHTGRYLKGAIAECKIGVFGKSILQQEEIEIEEPEEGPKSKIIIS